MVGKSAGLYAGEVGVELTADRARLIAIVVYSTCIEVDYLADGTDHSGSATGGSFIKGAKLLHRDGTPLHRQA